MNQCLYLCISEISYIRDISEIGDISEISARCVDLRDISEISFFTFLLFFGGEGVKKEDVRFHNGGWPRRESKETVHQYPLQLMITKICIFEIYAYILNICGYYIINQALHGQITKNGLTYFGLMKLSSSLYRP